MLKNLSYKTQLYFVLILGLILRLIQLDRSFSNDEFSAYFRFCNEKSFQHFIEFGVMPDGHPAGIQCFLWIWTSFFGWGEVVSRLPFAVAGVLALFFFYLAFEKWYNHKSALLTIGLLAVLEMPIMYSQLARPYAFGFLAIGIQLYFWVKIFVLGQRSWKNFILLGLISVGSFYVHYMSAFVVVIILLSGLFYVKKEDVKKVVVLSLLIIVLFLPHLDITLHHLSLGGLDWLGQPQLMDIWYVLVYPFNDSKVILIICLASIILGISVWKQEKRWLPIVWFLIFLLVIYLKSVLGKPIMQHALFIFVLPFLLITITSYKKWNYWWIGIIAMHTIFIRSYYEETRYGNFESIAHQLESIREKISVYADVNQASYLEYYVGKREVLYNVSEIKSIEKDSFYYAWCHKSRLHFDTSRYLVKDLHINLIPFSKGDWPIDGVQKIYLKP